MLKDEYLMLTFLILLINESPSSLQSSLSTLVQVQAYRGAGKVSIRAKTDISMYTKHLIKQGTFNLIPDLNGIVEHRSPLYI